MNISFSPGSVFISYDGVTQEHFGTPQDFEIEFTPKTDISQPVKMTDSIELEVKCTIDRESVYKLYGAWDAVKECCPNRRVAHLMGHKRKKIRMKNFHRAVRIMRKGES